MACLAGAMLAAQAVYAPIPGPSAFMVAGYAGLHPFRPLTAPVWGALIQALALLPGVPLSAAAALLQVVLGAATVYFSARILIELPYRELMNDPARQLRDDALPRGVAAAGAALFLTASTAFQTAFLMPYPDAMGALFLLLAWWMFQRFLIIKTDQIYLYLCAAVLSLGAVESASVALAAPLFAVYAFVVLGIRRQFSARVVLLSLVSAMAGVLVLAASVWLYYRSPAAEWREVARLRDVFDLFRREYMAAGPRAIPKQGWLVIFLLALLPLPFAFSGRLQQREEYTSDMGASLMRFVFFPAIAALILFDLPGAPMRITSSDMPLLTPYALSALWFGRLLGIAFAWLQYPPLARGARRPDRESLRPKAVALLAVSIMTVVAAWVLNRPVEQRRCARALAAMTDDAIEACSPGGWIVSDGSLDAALRIRARDRRLAANALDLGAMSSKAYRRFVQAAHGFAPSEWVEAVGLDIALQDWVGKEMRAGRPPVGLFDFDVPLPEGARWRPVGVIAVAEAATNPPPDTSALEGALGVIRERLPLPTLKPFLSLGLARQREWLTRAGARRANEIGVALHEAGAQAAAVSAFAFTLALQPDHLAAMINLHESRRAEDEAHDTNLVERIRSEWHRLPPGAAARALRMRFGPVILPSFAHAESAEWAAYGFGARAMKVSETAESGHPEPALSLLRARLLAASGQTARAADELESALNVDPDSAPYRLELLRLKAATGNIDEARAMLDELRNRLPERVWRLESARLTLAEGRIEEAVPMLLELRKREPTNPESALLLAISLEALGREVEWRDALVALEQATGLYPRGLLYLAELALRNNDRPAAVRYLERAHAVQPGLPAPLESLLEIELTSPDPAPIEKRARALLAIDPAHPRAWYAIGVSMARRARWEQAAEAFEKAAARAASFRELNDWAWALHQLGRSEEALEKSASACDMQPGEPFLWATRGKIAFDAGRYDLAIESFERVRALSRPATPVLLALLQSYEALGNAESAANIRAEIEARAASMTEPELRELRGTPIKQR